MRKQIDTGQTFTVGHPDRAAASGRRDRRKTLEAHAMGINLTPETHQGLAEMYVSDPRFTRTYDDVAPGLAQYVCAAILALYR